MLDGPPCRRDCEIAQLGPVEKERVEATRRDAELQKERILITHERQRDDKERTARDLALSAGGPGWRGLRGSKAITREEAEATAKRQVEERHQQELAEADERRARRIDEILALDGMKNPARQKERDNLDILKQQKRQDREASRPAEQDRDRGRER
jgi:hypothetical protein